MCARARWLEKFQHPLVTGSTWQARSGEPRLRLCGILRYRQGRRLWHHHSRGELCGAFSVRDALDLVQPSRIGHGVRAIEDADLVRRLADEGVVLEVCPASNIALKVFPDYDSHSLPALVKAGVKVCINSDDPPFFHTSLARITRLSLAWASMMMPSMP